MGATGSGKSTFVDLLTGSVPQSDTDRVIIADAFNLDDHRVMLIDTPGFGHPARTDKDVLCMIAAFLEISYEKGFELAGVLYFHQITDVKMGGEFAKNAKMLRKICGDRALKNAVIVTTMWDGVDSKIGTAREAELMDKDLYFKSALDMGAMMSRHSNTVSSAEGIVRRILGNTPMPLLIQVELVDEQKPFSHTATAGLLDRRFGEKLQ